MGLFERYLSLWVALCIAAGVGLGLAAPGLFSAVADIEYANVNLVVAVFIWVMIDRPSLALVHLGIAVKQGNALV